MTVKYFDLESIVQTAVKEAVGDATEMVRDEVKRLVLETPKTGRLYPYRGGVHQASAPGEAYANMSGNALAKTVTYQENNGMTGVVSAEAEYAGFLEFGTTKMAPRPTYRPALENKTDEIVQTINDKIKSVL